MAGDRGRKSRPEPLDDKLRLGVLVGNVDRDQEMQRENNIGGQILNGITHQSHSTIPMDQILY